MNTNCILIVSKLNFDCHNEGFEITRRISCRSEIGHLNSPVVVAAVRLPHRCWHEEILP